MNTKEVEEKVMPTKRTDRFTVDIANVEVEKGFNKREDYGDIDELMWSIINNGQQEDCVGFKKRGSDVFTLTEGHRRYVAIKKANELGHKVAMKIVLGSSNIEDRYMAMLITGTDKKLLNAVEEGALYKQLVSFGWDVKKIHEKSRKSVPHIYNAIALADAPQKVKNYVIKGDIAAATVNAILREVKDYNQIVQVIEDAVTKAKESGTDKKATMKHVTSEAVVKSKSAMQKLNEAYDYWDGKGEVTEQFQKLIDLLNDKSSTVKQIANVFKPAK